MNMPAVTADVATMAQTSSAELTGEPNTIGRVVSVSGGQVICLLNAPEGPASRETMGLQIGSLVRLRTPASNAFGIVSGMTIPIPARDANSDEMKIVELELVGEVPLRPDGKAGPFRRGISASPALDDAVLAATQEDLQTVYQRRSEHAVEIGRLHQNRAVPAYVVVDDLLGKHFSILGTTGSGKSCAVSLLLNAIVAKHANAHIVLLDPHAEYANAFKGLAECIEPDDLRLPHWLFNFEEMVEIVFGAQGPHMMTETTILRDMIQRCKVRFTGSSEESRAFTVDTPTPYKFGDLLHLLEQTMGRLENRSDLTPYHRIKARLLALQSDRRYTFLFPSGVVVRDNLTAILARIFRVPVAGKPISIVNLSGVPSEVLNVVVSVLCRMTFDFALWSDQRVPLLLVCEEAHRYAPARDIDGFEPTKRALARIAKEGRKYGISLGIVSQRPSEIAANVLSQCNTLFAMRMTSEKDQDCLRAAMSEATGGLIDSLPSLGNGEAVAVGEGVAVPMRLVFNQLEEGKMPHSGTAKFSAAWRDGDGTEESLKEVVARWRQSAASA